MAVHSALGFLTLVIGILTWVCLGGALNERDSIDISTRSRRKVFALSMIMIAVVAFTGAYQVVRELHHSAIEHKKSVLLTLITCWEGTASILASRDPAYGHPDDAQTIDIATMRQVAGYYASLGRPGMPPEFILAKREGNGIVFLLSGKPGSGRDRHDTIALDSNLAEPMRRALSGQTGTMIGLDYQGERVVAAYIPFAKRGWGLVGKVDLAAVEAPFFRLSLLAGGAALAVIVLGAIVFLVLVDPMIRRLADRTLKLQREIAERKQAEKGMREYAHIVSSSRDMLALLDKDFCFLAVNTAYADAFGTEPENLVGKSVVNVFGKKLFEKIIKPNGCRALSGEIVTFEDWYGFPAFARKKYMEVAYFPYFAENKAIAGFVVCARDRTDRIMSEGRYQAIFESSRDAIMTLQAPSWKFTNGNQAAIDLFGAKSAADFTSRTPWEFSPEKQKDGTSSSAKAKDMIGKAMKEGSNFFEWTHLRLNGETFLATVLLTRVQIGVEVFLQATVRDVSEIRKAEEAVLNVQKLESLGILAGGIAHDFNNILTGILGNLSLAKVGSENSKELVELISESQDACLTAQGLTRQLLTFSKGGRPLTKVVALGPIVKEACTFAARGTRAKCHFFIDDDLLPGKVDKDQLAQVLQNLVINAAQAMPKGGKIIVAASNVGFVDLDNSFLPGGSSVKIVVQDEGDGIPPAKLPKVFDPYFSTKTNGRGLGLATSHSIITNHGGTIEVESTIGIGTVFTILLPAANPQDLQPVLEAPVIKRGSGRVLIMDDEGMVVRVLERMLRKVGYECESVTNGEQLLDSYEKADQSGQPFDVVIMDLTIPCGMGGQEAVQKLKELNPDVKAIVSSGYSGDPVMSEYAKHGFSGVLAKPYRISEVSDIVRRVIGLNSTKADVEG